MDWPRYLLAAFLLLKLYDSSYVLNKGMTFFLSSSRDIADLEDKFAELRGELDMYKRDLVMSSGRDRERERDRPYLGPGGSPSLGSGLPPLEDVHCLADRCQDLLDDPSVRHQVLLKRSQVLEQSLADIINWRQEVLWDSLEGLHDLVAQLALLISLTLFGGRGFKVIFWMGYLPKYLCLVASIFAVVWRDDTTGNSLGIGFKEVLNQGNALSFVVFFLALMPVVDYTRGTGWFNYETYSDFACLYCLNILYYILIWRIIRGEKSGAKTESGEKKLTKLNCGKEKVKVKDQVKYISSGKEPTVREYPDSWFFHACLYGHSRIVRRILKNGTINVDVSCHVNGYTGLHLACLYDQRSVAQVLADNKAKPASLSVKDKDGRTPLAVAAAQGHRQLLKMLIKSPGFSWKRADVESLLVAALERDHFELAHAVAVDSGKNDYRDPSVPAYLMRCDQLQKQLRSNRNMHPSKVASATKSLMIYKESLLTILASAKRDQHGNSTTGDHGYPGQSRPSLNELREHFECPICSEEMCGEGVHIFACSNDHWICSRCLQDPRILLCPTCREDFKMNAPKRCLTAERIALRLG